MSNRWKYYLSLFSLLVHLLVVLLFHSSCANLLVKDKKTAQIYLRLGNSQLENGNYPEALSTLLKAEREDPSDPNIHNSLGLAYFVRDHFDEAEEHFSKAVSLSADFSEAKKNLGRVYIEKGKFKEAVKILDEVRKDLTYNQPEEPLLYLGIAYFKLGYYQKSQDILTECLTYSRENCQAKSFLGRSFYELKKYLDASVILDNAVKSCKDLGFDEPHYYAALSYFQLGKLSEALTRLEEIGKLYPQGKYKELSKKMILEIKK